MSSTNPNGNAVVRLTLTPEQAKQVSHQFDLAFGELESRYLSTREDTEAVLERITRYKALQEQVAWGEPAGTVTLTLSYDELVKLADDLLESGADAMGSSSTLEGLEGIELVRERRRLMGESLTGVAILEQLEALR